MAKQSIVTLGGGSGQFALLSSLRDVPNIDISAVVSMTDSGGSTGKLRDELGTLPPGDILKCILALSPLGDTARGLLQQRFSSSTRLEGHNAGNMLLTMLSEYTGKFSEGVDALAEILQAKGHIMPVTMDKATLVAELSNGERIFGEKAIDVPRGTQRHKIEEVFLVPHHADTVQVYPPVLDAIQHADVLIIAPGDLFTSVVPNLLVPGVAQAIKNSSARLWYVCNLMTKFGETESFTVESFIKVLKRYIGRMPDDIIYNHTLPPAAQLARYAKQKAELIEFAERDKTDKKVTVHSHDLLETAGGVLRHDVHKLRSVLEALLNR